MRRGAAEELRRAVDGGATDDVVSLVANDILARVPNSFPHDAAHEVEDGSTLQPVRSAAVVPSKMRKPLRVGLAPTSNEPSADASSGAPSQGATATTTTASMSQQTPGQFWSRALCKEDYPPSSPFRLQLVDAFVASFRDARIVHIKDERTKEARKDMIEALTKLISAEDFAPDEVVKARMRAQAFSLVEALRFTSLVRADIEGLGGEARSY